MCSRVRIFMRKLVKFEEVPVHGGNFVTVTAPMIFKTTSKFVARDPLENEFVTKMVGFPRLWSRTNLLWSYANRFSLPINYDGVDVLPDYLCPFEFSKILLREFYGRTKCYHRGVVHFVGSTFHADVGGVSFLKGKWSICVVVHGDTVTVRKREGDIRFVEIEFDSMYCVVKGVSESGNVLDMFNTCRTGFIVEYIK